MAVALLSRKCHVSRKCLPEAIELNLCEFENLQNATFSFVLSISPSAWTKVAFRWTDLREIKVSVIEVVFF